MQVEVLLERIDGSLGFNIMGGNEVVTLEIIRFMQSTVLRRAFRAVRKTVTENSFRVERLNPLFTL